MGQDYSTDLISDETKLTSMPLSYKLLSWIWTSIPEFFIENSVTALDLRGHGLYDERTRGYVMDHLLADLESALETLKVKGKIVLIGHSFGGAIVTEYTLKHPKQVERLIMISTPGEFKR